MTTLRSKETGWLAQALGKASKAGNLLVHWVTGPLAGREARVPRSHMGKACNAGRSPRLGMHCVRAPGHPGEHYTADAMTRAEERWT